MGRLCLAVGVILACVAPGRRALAAEVTRVATAAEANNAFEMELSVRWDRIQEKALITRERPLDGAASPPYGRLQDAPQLRYLRQANVIVPRAAFGLYEDLELHVELPYVLNDDRSWRYALVNGVPADVAYPGESIGDNTIDAMNRTCPGGPCPLFSVPGTVYHGGKLGDIVVGVAWAILNDRKDETSASWVIGLDVTAPSAQRYDPAEGRGASNWDSPNAVPAKPGLLGEKVWRYEMWTALSRRYGAVDPYLRGNVTAVRPSSKTYSNCEHADTMSQNAPAAQFTLAGAANCLDPTWKDSSGAQLPWLAGATFGVEVVPFEKASAGQKVSLDLRGTVEYTSRQRFFNPLTDATGKLLWTEPFYTMGGKFTLRLKASKFFTFDALATYQTQTDHLLTGENLGKAGVLDGDVTGVTPNTALNPNYDWRWDAPGRRFRLKESNIFTAAFAAHLTF